MPNYSEAKTEWRRALREAGNDPELVRGLLLARILQELEENRSSMKAVAEVLASKTDQTSTFYR